MAVPANMTTLDFSGTFVLNKSLSNNDETDLILKYQGLNWLIRKTIGIATLTIHVKHYKDENGLEHIDIRQALNAGIGSTTEERSLNWEIGKHSDHIFGAVVGRNRRVAVADIKDEFLKKGWSDDTIKHGVIEDYAASDTEKSGMTWVAEQVWGLEVINGERRYSRHIKFVGNNNEIVEAYMVYDYC